MTASPGRFLQPGDDGYEQRRRVWNGMIDRRPALIALAANRDDVVAAVAHARDQGLILAVRGGGHSFAGFSTCDGGLVLDLSPMCQIQIDGDKRIARVGGGATWAQFDAAAHTHGLATTGGLISTTGVAGLTLGGGIGWLHRRCGLACDNLLAAELITASGEVVRTSPDENPDLFWGIRGGGGNFGVVTEFEFRLHPVSTVIGGLLLFPLGQAAEVMRFYRDFVTDCPDELTTWLSLITAPAEDFVPSDLQGRVALAVLACHCGDPEDAERALAPLRGLGPAADLIEPTPYPDLQSAWDEDLPHGVRCYMKAGFLPELTDSAIDTIVANAADVTSGSSTFDLHHMGGAVGRVPEDATAFGDRRSPFVFNIVGAWKDSSEDDAGREWVRTFARALEPSTTGRGYVNFSADADRARSSYSPRTYERLQALKRAYDPGNLFRLNQNVVP